jgi:hypothetical protein
VTLKKLFVVTAAIATGAVLALAVIIGVIDWWSSRPAPRDSESVIAEYDRAFVTGMAGEKKLELRYTLANQTESDIQIFGSDLTVFVRRSDGSLYDLRKLHEAHQSDVTIPAGERVIWFLETGIRYRKHGECEEVEIVEDANRDQSQAFVDACYGYLKGFRMQTGSTNLLIELPTPVSQAKNDSAD